jgi:hypothetical protein
MWGKHLGANIGGNQPVPSDWHIADQRRIFGLPFFPARKIHSPGKGRQHHELGKGYARLQRHVYGRIEGCRRVCRQPEDEGTEHMNAVLFECLQLLSQSLARVVEVFEDRFQSFRCYGLDPDQSTLDIGLPHSVQILAVLPPPS